MIFNLCLSSYLLSLLFDFLGWVEDAKNNLEVNAEELNELVFSLWAAYLQKINIAFVKKPTLSRKPGFRDFQVRLFNRRRVLSTKKILDYKNEALKEPEKKAEEQIDYDGDSTESRRRRSKAKRSFLESVASSFSEFDESSTSYLSSSAVSDIDSDDESVSDWTDENNTEIQETHLRILSRSTIFKNTKNVSYKMDIPRKKLVFSIFCLAVLLLENNTYTLSDLIRFAKSGVLSYDTCSQHIPQVIKIKSLFDLTKLTGLNPKSNSDQLLYHLVLRKYMSQLGSMLNLNSARFGNIKSLIKRYLKEFSLPKYMAKMLERSFGQSGLLDMDMTFYDRKEHYAGKIDNVKPLISSDLRAVALILLALKYCYGLDDVSEYFPRNNQAGM